MYPIMTSCVSVEGTTNLGPVARLEFITKWLKRGHVKNIPSLNLELWNNFFAKNIPKTPKNELRQAPTMAAISDPPFRRQDSIVFMWNKDRVASLKKCNWSSPICSPAEHHAVGKQEKACSEKANDERKHRHAPEQLDILCIQFDITWKGGNIFL